MRLLLGMHLQTCIDLKFSSSVISVIYLFNSAESSHRRKAHICNITGL